MTELLRRPSLLTEGHTDESLRRAVATGALLRVRPGTYLPAPASARDPVARHRFLVHATAPVLTPGSVFSGISAAVLHGLPIWRTPLRRIHVTRDRRSGGRSTANVVLHAAPLPPDEVVLLDGLAVTSVARTVVDVARSCAFETAVVVADAALWRHLVTVTELEEVVRTAAGRRGIAGARAVLAFTEPADGPGESRSRVCMHRLGIPAPRIQHAVRDHGGRRVGQVDFWWEDAGVIGEFDGLTKYGRSLQPGESPQEALVREKRREDALRAQPRVRAVVRWTWEDLDDFTATATRLKRLLLR
ncbi:hypothetical protein [Pseudonocardia phyllosphaerae]|uniref:hypothetical protein n=1 Tax=Pseudonocardia phyllosphaerae TaxID=3390502 RepID=UPI0039786288